MRSAVCWRRFRTQSLLPQRPDLDQISPATPATCGVAIEVPLRVPYFEPDGQ
jgi:hypothetical protein